MQTTETGTPRVVTWTVSLVTVVIVVSLVAGLAAAAVGGSLTRLGSGYGGLYGLPAMVLTVIALSLTVAKGVSVAHRSGKHSSRMKMTALCLVGVWVVAISFSLIAHMIDPCINGWWGTRSRIGSQPLCERFGPELNWHSRFHLLAHAAPAALLLAAYIWVVRRLVGRNTISSAPPDEGPSLA